MMTKLRDYYYYSLSFGSNRIGYMYRVAHCDKCESRNLCVVSEVGFS